ncbi:SCA7, zinc-binding domain-containing protein [Massariosphaeria phaeospora]|uniref:SCA7, zinc-binding domain-containing protein n=1 Tax=Massariosphaeria phaeospora TaxID=100035 RepID=A0A7C8MF69_9PLEO|nr:SCA7, zinc-binding domain-containing protein [Massariosphaeria phaeospora]
MAPNGARKAPPGRTSSPKASLVDTKTVKSNLHEKEKKAIILKIKKPVPKPSLPGNWKESDSINVEPRKTATPAGGSPVVNPLGEKTVAGFSTGRPLDDKVDVVQCKHCRRPVLRASSATHIRECLNKKQEKLKKKKEAKEAKDAALRKEKGEKDDDDGGKNNARKSAVKGAVVDGDGVRKGKKRKLDVDAEKAPNAKKKKKDEPKAKAAKPKGPVDVEKQCGVILPNGFCARSLTCKSHSMGLKRAVPGRSLPYDMLLAQYQKRNQAMKDRQLMNANAALPEDLEPSGAVDSDEEKEAIMAVLARHRPRPMATYTPVLQKSKYQYIRMKDMLRSALGAPPGGGSLYSNIASGGDNIGTGRNLGLGMMGAPSSATNENFPGSASGMGSFAPPLSAGLDGPAGGGMNSGSRRQSSISMVGASAGPRQILPGQLPGPGPQQRKGSMASVASVS